MVLGALSALLSLEGDIEVVATVTRGDEVLPVAISTRPDVALLDIEMPGLDGLSAAAALRAHLSTCRVVILTTFGKPGYLRRAMDSGVVGFLVKDAPPEELAASIRRVAAGERVIDPQLAVSALSIGQNPLTEREREVLRASENGTGVSEIAAQMSLSEGTVRNYLSEAIQKLDARNRIEAAQIARDQGWL